MNTTSTPSITFPYIHSLADCDNATRRAILLEQGARGYIDCCNWPDEFPSRPLTVFHGAHDGKRIYLEYLVEAPLLVAHEREEQGAVSDDSCVEVFLRPEGSETYWNIEFNTGCVANAAERHDRHRKEALTAEQIATIEREYTGDNVILGTEQHGTFTWRMLMAIPLDIMRLTFNGAPLSLTGNFYSCAGGASKPYFMSWAPIDTPTPDFHQPRCFGKITLGTSC